MGILVEELGSGYISEMFVGCYLLKDDKVHSLQRVSRTTITTTFIDLKDPGPPRWQAGTLPIEVLGNFKDISWPKLGYRNILCPYLGNVVVYSESLRSTLRGLRWEGIQRFYLPALQSAVINLHDFPSATSQAVHIKALFSPQWVGFREGMKKLMDGQWSGFALNEDFAISVATESPSEDSFDIFYRRKAVGTVNMRGAVSINNKMLRKGSLSKLIDSIEGV